MPKRKDAPVDYAELERAMKKVVKEIISELEKMLASKTDISDYTDRVIARLDAIDRHFIELKAEMRNLRIMYEFWADRHLSPDLMEEFLKEQEKKRGFKEKKVEA